MLVSISGHMLSPELKTLLSVTDPCEKSSALLEDCMHLPMFLARNIPAPDGLRPISQYITYMHCTSHHATTSIYGLIVQHGAAHSVVSEG